MYRALFLLVDSTAAAVLIVAGTGKAVSPRPAAKYLGTLAAWFSAPAVAWVSLVRSISALELTTAVLLLIAATRPLAAVMLGVLSIGIGVVAVASLRERLTSSCGCFGMVLVMTSGRWPIVAVAIGLVVSGGNLVLAAPADYQPAMPLALICVVAICLAVNVEPLRRLRPSQLAR